ncbi:MAG: cobalamin-dependent protein [Gaiellales bacterium]
MGSTEASMLTLQEAADVVGCHYQTLYRRVRSGDIPALVAGGSYRIRREDLDTWLSERDQRSGAVPDRGQRDWPAQADRLFSHLITGDTDAARQQIDRLLAGGTSVAEFCDSLFAPILFRIGDLWRRGEITIGDEHRASRTVESLLERVLAARPKPGPRLGTVVVAAPRGDRHSLPGQMVAFGLRADGFIVHHLGADLPPDEIADLATREQADLVALSCATGDREGLVEAMRALAAAGFPVLVGGAGIGSAEAIELGAARYGGSVAEAQLAARAIVRERAAAR